MTLLITIGHVPIEIRPFTAADAGATLEVFRRAIRGIAAADYSSEQIAAWAADDIDLDAWAESRDRLDTAVAVIDGVLVGFTDVDAAGYIDMLYVDPVFGRRGVATALLDWVTAEAERLGSDTLRTHASITARPFFEAQGFAVDEERHPIVRGVVMTNYTMSRTIRHRP